MKKLIYGLLMLTSVFTLAGCKADGDGTYGSDNPYGVPVISDSKVTSDRTWCSYIGEQNGEHTVIRYTFAPETFNAVTGKLTAHGTMTENVITYTDSTPTVFKVFKAQGLPVVWEATPTPQQLIVTFVMKRAYIDMDEWNKQSDGFSTFNLIEPPVFQILLKSLDFDLLGTATLVAQPQSVMAYPCDEISPEMAVAKENQP